VRFIDYRFPQTAPFSDDPLFVHRKMRLFCIQCRDMLLLLQLWSCNHFKNCTNFKAACLTNYFFLFVSAWAWPIQAQLMSSLDPCELCLSIGVIGYFGFHLLGFSSACKLDCCLQHRCHMDKVYVRRYVCVPRLYLIVLSAGGLKSNVSGFSNQHRPTSSTSMPLSTFSSTTAASW
jgi:hypothetical protein